MAIPDHIARFIDDQRAGTDAELAAAGAGLRVVQGREQPSGFYVYGLVERPAGALFYVGKGIRSRWRQHARETQPCNMAKWARIQAAAGVVAVIFAEGLDESAAYDLERTLIAALREQLTNLQAGGRSLEQRISHEIAMSKLRAQSMLARLVPFDEWCRRRQPTPEEVTMYHALVAEMRKVAAHGWRQTWVFRNGRVIGEVPGVAG